MHAAAEVVDEFPNGVFFVSLAPLRSAELVVPTIAQTLGLRQETGRSASEVLRAYLADKRMLLLIDNFEHVSDAAGELAAACAEAREITLLVTSRGPIHLAGEHSFSLSPLALPEATTLGEIARADAVALFVERALAARPDFELSDQNSSDVAELCARLDGLPLAIELAAARVRALPPKTIVTRLNRRFQLLTGGSRDTDARHQTLRATLDWSYDLLNDGEKTLLRRLSVFKGGCRIEAAEKVCDVNGDLAIDVLDGLVALTEQSLLRQREDADGSPRFWMLESVLSYAAELLEASPEHEAVANAHLEHMRQFALDAEPHWRDPEPGGWRALFNAEIDNVRAAVEFATATNRAAEAAEILTAFAWLWENGYVAEGRARLEEVLPAARRSASEEVLAYAEFSLLLWRRHEETLDLDKLRSVAELCDEAGRGDLAALARVMLAGRLWVTGQRREAMASLERAEDAAERLQDDGVRSWTVGTRAFFLIDDGKTAEARSLIELDLQRPYYKTNPDHEIAILHTLTDIDLAEDDAAAAVQPAERALALALETDDVFQLPDAHAAIAHVALLLGQHERARRHLQLAEETERHVRPTLGKSPFLEELRVIEAALAAATGAHADALTAWARTQQFLHDSGRELPPALRRLVVLYLDPITLESGRAELR